MRTQEDGALRYKRALQALMICHSMVDLATPEDPSAKARPLAATRDLFVAVCRELGWETCAKDVTVGPDLEAIRSAIRKVTSGNLTIK